MASKAKTQRGGFFLGAIIGLLVGVLVALGVALYVTKVPIPFVDKVPQRSAEQDAAEAERNKTWDPNAPLAGRHPARPNNEASGVVSEAASAAALPASAASRPAAARAALAASAASGAVAAASAKTEAEALQFYVQVGAYARSEDAEQQRAKLGLSGLAARITERDQGGRVMYRVRLGPFDSHEEATAMKEQAASAGYTDATLVRVPRNP